MRYIPSSSYGSKASGSLYHIPGGFCLTVQPSAPDHDVVPDLPASDGTVTQVKSSSRFTAVLRAGYAFIGMLIATSGGKRAEARAWTHKCAAKGGSKQA